MDQPIIAVTCDDGSVKVVCLTFEPEPTRVQQEVEKIFSNPSYTERPVSWRFITEADLPEKLGERLFRGALRDDGKTLTHDMGKARAIQLGRLRALRDVKLAALDVDWSRALARGGEPAAAVVETRRQALRDYPQTVLTALESAQTVEELKAITLPE